MQISYYFKNIDPTEAIKNYISDKLGKLDDRFHHVEGVDARLSVLRQNQIFELTIHADATVFHLKKGDKDLYAAIDSTVDSLNKQVDRHHKKLTERSAPELPMMAAAVGAGADEFDTLIQVHDAPIKPMDDREGILQLQAQKFRFLMFHGYDQKRYSLLFLRPDGNYSVIKPAGEPGQYIEDVLQFNNNEVKTISSSLYPMSQLSISEAIEKLEETQADFMVFVNAETLRMNLLFLSKNGDLILQKPAV